MQPNQDLLKQAVTAARAGHELTARDMFLRVVESEPQNELAWMWLIGLHDELADRIHACEQVLGINPRNDHARQYLEKLMAEKQKISGVENARIVDQVRGLRDAITAGRKDSALADIRVLAANPQLNHPDVWQLLAELSPELDERVRALEKLSALVPNDPRVLGELKQARHLQKYPMHQAELYEEKGEIDKALGVYRMVVLKPESKEQWNKAYWKISQLENLQQENIAHISPVISIARLTAGPPLVYFMFALIHVGVNPFANFDPLVWLGLLWVILGGFMTALAAVRSRNPLWKALFKDSGTNGSPTARRVMSSAGWALVLLPHVMLLASAWFRLMNYLAELINQS